MRAFTKLLLLTALLAGLVAPAADAQLFNSPARWIVRYDAAPATCRAGQVYFDTVTAKMMLCTAVDTWSEVFWGGTLTGPILLPDGTAAAPALAFNDQTGIYQNTDGQMIFSFGGVGRMQFVGGSVYIPSGAQYIWKDNATPPSGNNDTGFSRASAGVVKVTNGGAGDGTLQSAGVIHGYVAKTADYTATATDHTIAVTSAANTTIALPAAASHTGRIYVVRKMDASANTVTIDPNAAETINGAATYVVPNTTSVMIQSTGTAWIILSVS